MPPPSPLRLTPAITEHLLVSRTCIIGIPAPKPPIFHKTNAPAFISYDDSTHPPGQSQLRAQSRSRRRLYLQGTQRGFSPRKPAPHARRCSTLSNNLSPLPASPPFLRGKKSRTQFQQPALALYRVMWTSNVTAGPWNTLSNNRQRHRRHPPRQRSQPARRSPALLPRQDSAVIRQGRCVIFAVKVSPWAPHSRLAPSAGGVVI